MLNITPNTKPIFLAGWLDDDLAAICQQISVSPEGARRMALVNEAQAVIAKMRENAVQNFGGRPFIMDNLSGLEEAIRELAERPLLFTGENACPVCGGPLMAGHHSSKHCSKCLDRVDDYRQRLESDDGFSTSSI
jgi:hypothetical protein